MAILSRFLGRTVETSAGFAVGGAIRPYIEPRLQDRVNAAWSAHASVPLDPADAAEVVAEDVELLGWGRNEAKQTGINSGRFDALYNAVLNAPGLSELLTLWRRGQISDGDFEHGLRKSRLEGRWDGALRALKDVLLSPADLAMARQQGFVDENRARSEAELQGVNGERADILFELSGLPPGAETAQSYLNRGLIDQATFDQIIREGHTKTKYTDLMRQGAAAVLHASTYVTANLKGWITDEARNAGGALTGHTPEQMNLMYLAAGRPAAPGQMATAAARGIDGPDGRPMDEEQFLKGIRESDIRPEWGPMLWEARFLYPPLFQLSRLVSSGAITPEIAADWATKDRYPPEVVQALSAFWRKGGGGAAKQATATDLLALYEGLTITHGELVAALEALGYPAAEAARKAEIPDARRVASARTTAIGGVHTAYKKHDATANEVDAALVKLGVGPQARPEIIAAWTAERDVARPELTAAQVVAAYKRAVITRDAALADLEARGYDPGDAAELLDTGAVVLTVKQIQDAVEAKTITRDEGLRRLRAQGYSAADAAILLPT